MKTEKLWLLTAALQLVFTAVNAYSGNTPAALGGLFGAYMCAVHYSVLRRLQA